MSQIRPLMFFYSKKLLSWTYLLKETSRGTKILRFPVWNKIGKIWDTIFGIIQIEAQCSKNYFKHFLSQESGASRKNIENGSQKVRPKMKYYFAPDSALHSALYSAPYSKI